MENQTTKVCSSCGNLIAPNASSCPSCGNSGQSMRCPNGHIGDSEQCSWCGAKASVMGDGEAERATCRMDDMNSDRPTMVVGSGGDRATEIWNPQKTVVGGDSGKTIIRTPPPRDSEQEKMIPPQNQAMSPQNQGISRIVGFLVSYTLEPQGFFYPIREGRQNIGRANTNSLHINDNSLSSEHAIILYRNGRFILQDEMSSNGSLLNGHEVIGQKELVHGDCLIMGSNTFFVVVIPQG